MFKQLNLTTAGAILASQTALGDQIEFTKIKMGDGAEPADFRVLTDLVHVMQSMPIARAKIVDVNTVALGSNLFPKDITTNFYWREIGLFARNVTKGTPEVLFSYGYTDTPSYISSGGTLTEKYIDIDAQLDDAENVVINLDYSNLFPTKHEMSQALADLDEKVQNDIRSSKNIWMVDKLDDLAGGSVNKSTALLANLNTKSTGEQAVPNVGDLVITNDGHVGYIEEGNAGTYKLTTINNPVERKKKYDNGDWEMYLSQAEGGGHYYWDHVQNVLRFEGLVDDKPQIVYKRSSCKQGGANFQTTGGTGVGARILTAWSGGTAGQGQLQMFYTKNVANDNYTANDEIATVGYVQTYVADNSGIFVGTAATHAALLAGTITGTPAGHQINLNDWVIVENDETHNKNQTSYICTNNQPRTWTFATVRDIDIPGVDNSTIYLNSSGKYAVKPGAPVQLGNNTITDANIGNRTLSNPTESTTIPTSGTLTQLLQGLANNIKYLMEKTVKAPSQKIYMYVQDASVTPETGINKVRIPITENQ